MIHRFLRIAMALSIALGLWLGPAGSGLALSEEQQLYNEAWRIVSRAYLDESFNGENWWLVRQKVIQGGLVDRAATYGAIQQSLGLLGDPFTRLLKPDQYRSLQVTTSGELTGVGLQIALDEAGRSLVVISPVAGSPAEAAGLQPNDHIAAIDGQTTQALSLDDAAAKMRGPIGTQVCLTIDRATDRAKEKSSLERLPDICIKRDRIELNPVTAALKTDATGKAIGYLRLGQFNANATTELAKAIGSLERQGAKAYILDLRNNPGGLLTAGIEIARLWLHPTETIVYTVDRQGLLDSYQAQAAPLTESPLVVLVNAGTASASEILAGALQDNGRAQLVGQKTFGKGLIQSLFELSDGAGLAVTIAKYETPGHHDINKLGIQPDREVVMDNLSRDQIATDADAQYLAAVELLRSAPALSLNPAS
jgi:carboxyl-terminal processing protease